MDRKTLIGFLLIGLILLLWPTYLELLSPSKPQEKVTNETVVVEDIIEKYSGESAKKDVSPNVNIEVVETTVNGGLYSAKVSSLGGGSIVSFEIKDHLKKSEASLNLVDRSNKENLVISFIDQSGDVVVLDKGWVYSGPEKHTLSEENPSTSLLYQKTVLGKRVTKKLIFNHNSYVVTVETSLREIKDLTLDQKYTISWIGGLPQTEGSQDAMFMEGLISQAGSIDSYRVGSAGLFGGSSLDIERDSKQYVGQSEFVGYRTKYFGIFFVPQKSDLVEITKYSTNKRVGVDLGVVQDINFEKTDLFFGPLDYSAVSSLGVGLEKKILGWQWLSSVSWLVYTIMIFLHGLVPNYGVVVVLFAVLIKLVTYPLMAKQLRSSKKMQEISPELNRIKTKYKNNPTLQQQKIAALFQQNKINPLAGCLPLLIQMPVLMAVFLVFRNTIEFRGESFLLWINDLSAADTLFYVGSIPVNILPFLMSISMYYTMKMSTASQPAGGDPAQEATQQMMKYMFPGMMFFLFYSFPSGLNLYYFCFNLMQIAQQKIINNEPKQK